MCTLLCRQGDRSEPRAGRHRESGWQSWITALAVVGVAAMALPANAQYRTIDGSGNNIGAPQTAAAGARLIREDSGAHYADSIVSPAGPARPSPRLISNTVFSQSAPVYNSRNLSDMVWQWGQFLDHDMDLTPSNAADPFNIPVPMGDEQFDPGNTGTQVLPFNRSIYDVTTGTSVANPRQQVNEITGWIDASNVYGSDASRASWLRTESGGQMKTSAHATGDMLPFNDGTQPNDGGSSTSLFVAGDIRSNEQIGLSSMHTVFVREHNRIAADLATANPGWNDQQLYDKARQLVGAQMQAITYNEFLPALLGDQMLPASTGYDDSIDSSISNAFSSAAYRLGHTMLSDELQRMDNAGNTIPEGNIPLKDSFFSPDEVLLTGVDPVLKGLASQKMQEIDSQIVDSVRNFLFGDPGMGGMDLASLNIQRGRDHGLADFNTMREDFDLPRITSFSELTSDVSLQNMLAALYSSVDDLDPWVGLLAEDHAPNSSVGETLAAIMGDQFSRLRDGDRYWYERWLSPEEIAFVQGSTLASIIERNTGITSLQSNVFLVPEPGSGLLLLAAVGVMIRARRTRRA